MNFYECCRYRIIEKVRECLKTKSLGNLKLLLKNPKRKFKKLGGRDCMNLGKLSESFKEIAQNSATQVGFVSLFSEQLRINILSFL